MQVIVLTPDEFRACFDEMLIKLESTIKNSLQRETTSKEWLNSKEVCALLKISMTTLHDWSLKGLLIKHKSGRRIMFRHDEVLESLKRIESKWPKR
ncbi:MAG: helix-turn-helix domain-containing protein [Saprospiraceae bacterium]|nr:helix-turn-helix domain-containing protein [Saprospiraceae bacterium]